MLKPKVGTDFSSRSSRVWPVSVAAASNDFPIRFFAVGCFTVESKRLNCAAASSDDVAHKEYRHAFPTRGQRGPCQRTFLKQTSASVESAELTCASFQPARHQTSPRRTVVLFSPRSWFGSGDISCRGGGFSCVVGNATNSNHRNTRPLNFSRPISFTNSSAAPAHFFVGFDPSAFWQCVSNPSHRAHSCPFIVFRSSSARSLHASPAKTTGGADLPSAARNSCVTFRSSAVH